MPGVIDSFIVEWVLNPAKYLAGAKKLGEANTKVRTEEEKAAKAREQENKRAAEGVAKVRNEVVGLILAFQGASSVKSFVADLLAGDAATGRLAKNLNTSTNELSAWQLAVKTAGGEAQDANGAFGTMAQLLQNFKNTGLTGQENNLRALGLQPADLSNPAEALLKLADARERFVKAEGEGAGGAHFYGLAKGLGLSDGVINTLVKGRVELGRQIAELERHGAATDEDARRAADFEKQWTELQARLSGSVRPEIYRLVTAALDLLDAIDKGITDVPEFVAVLAPLAVAALAIESPFIAAGVAIVALLGYLGDLEKAYAHTVFATHGWIGGRDLYNQMVGAGVKNNADIDRIIDADRAKNGGGAGAGAADGGGGDFASAKAWNIAHGGAAALGGGPRGGGGKGGAGVEDVYSYFRQLGYSDAAARGIAAGVFSESGGNDRNVNLSSGAYGLAQWLTKDRLRDFRRTYGHDLTASTRAEQLAFIAKELRTTEGGAGSRIRGARSAQEALYAFVSGYERPGAGLGGDIRRGSRYLAQHGAGGGGGPITINGGVTVNTKATDADGIARDIVPAIRRRSTTTQANRGLD